MSISQPPAERTPFVEADAECCAPDPRPVADILADVRATVTGFFEGALTWD